MAFNISKCKIMQVLNHHSKSLFTYKINDIPLAFTEQHLYLGVKLYHKLPWKLHIDLHQSYIDQVEIAQHRAAYFVIGEKITETALNWPKLQKCRQISFTV